MSQTVLNMLFPTLGTATKTAYCSSTSHPALRSHMTIVETTGIHFELTAAL